MPEKIYTFSEEEVARMFKSGQMKLLTSPEPVQTQSDHEKALEKAKKLFGKEFEDVVTLQIGGKTKEELKQAMLSRDIELSIGALDLLNSPYFTTFIELKNINLVFVSADSLGLIGPKRVIDIYHKAEELGLELCPAEVGPHLRLQYLTNKFGGIIAMELIGSTSSSLQKNNTRVFGLISIHDRQFLAGPLLYYDTYLSSKQKILFSI